MKKIRKLAASLTHVLFIALVALAFFKADIPDDNENAAVIALPKQKRAAPSPAQPALPKPTPDTPPASSTAGAPNEAVDAKSSGTAAAAGLPAPTNKGDLLDRLVKAYPDFLSGHDGKSILWRDGARMVFDDGKAKTPGERLELADLEDQFFDAYPAGREGLDPPADFDPGRVRHEPFFQKMYGDCKTGEVDRRMGPVVWLRQTSAKRIFVTTVNGMDRQLQKVSDELDTLPRQFMKFLSPIAGVYSCRTIAGTARTSMHAYAAAIDINTAYGDYWQDAKNQSGAFRYRNRVPWEIVEVLEKHGFIWGGKWSHFDTFHFEYRPELLPGFSPAPTLAAKAPQKEIARKEERPTNSDARTIGVAPDQNEEVLPLPTRQPRDIR